MIIRIEVSYLKNLPTSYLSERVLVIYYLVSKLKYGYFEI